MPTFRITSPEGKVYRITGPEGATQEQAIQELQRQIASGTAIPIGEPAAPPPPGGGGPGAPAGPGAGLVGPPSGVGGPPATPIAGPAAAPPGPAREAERRGLSPAERAAMLRPIDPTEGMSTGELLLAGAGQSVASTSRGIQQLWNTLTGDEEDLARLKDEELEARKIDKALLRRGAGRAGQIAGHVLQAAIPAGGAARGAIALQKAVPVLAGGGRSLATVMGAEGLVGGGLGALEPITKGESRGKNVAVNAILSGLFPGAMQAGKFVRDLPLSVTSALVRKVLPTGSKVAGDIAARGARELTGEGLKGTKKKLWEELKTLTYGVGDVPQTKEMTAALKKIHADYGKAMGDWAEDRLKRMIKAGEPPKMAAPKPAPKPPKGKPPAPPPPKPAPPQPKMTGEEIQNIYAAMGAEAAEKGGAGALGMAKVRELLDEALKGKMTPYQRRELEAARKAYETGRTQVNKRSRARPITGAIVRALRDLQPGFYRKQEEEK